MKRLFSFGCSFVDGIWPTTSDYVGLHFDEYYNLGVPGASNTKILGNLIECDQLYNLNSETDFVLIGVSGVGRFSYFDPAAGWQTNGDIIPINPGHPKKTQLFSKEFFSLDWGIYDSWVAIKSIKAILASKEIEHIVYPSIDNSIYLDSNLLPRQGIVPRLQELIDISDIQEPIETFSKPNKIIFTNGDKDGHPSTQDYFRYFLKYFRRFDTPLAKELLNSIVSNFDFSSRQAQCILFHKIYNQFCNTKPTKYYYNI